MAYSNMHIALSKDIGKVAAAYHKQEQDRRTLWKS
jgi:hypothetical protein